MKRLLFFILSLKIGGSEKACVRMANALCGRYDVTVCTYFGGGELEGELDERIHVKKTFPRFIRGAARLAYLPPRLSYRLFVRGKYDLEVAVGDGLESHVISGSPNSDIFSWCHINLGNYGAQRNEKTRKRFASFRSIICVSEKNRACFEAEMGFADKLRVAYTPINEADILRQAEEPCELPENAVVAVGRLEKVKGFDRLIEAAAGIAEPGFRLYIYGDGTQRSELQRLIGQYGLEQKVFLMGSVRNPYPFVKRAGLLVCPSREESFGFTAVEAMLLKTPVLSTRNGGVEEIIREETQGLLCENSVEGIREGLLRFLRGEHGVDVNEAYRRALDFSEENGAGMFMNILEGTE